MTTFTMPRAVVRVCALGYVEGDAPGIIDSHFSCTFLLQTEMWFCFLRLRLFIDKQEGSEGLYKLACLR